MTHPISHLPGHRAGAFALPELRLAAEASLPTRFGSFRVLAFEGLSGQDYGVLVKGRLTGQQEVLVRMHSACFTGDIMGSVRCDCRDQLEAALKAIAGAERGAVIYLPQEGRGIGLVNKIRAYALQDSGLDTVEANLALGFADDERTYDVAAALVRALGIASVVLLSNNPRKQQGLERHGISVVRMQPLRAPANPHNASYLRTKKLKSGHLI